LGFKSMQDGATFMWPRGVYAWGRAFHRKVGGTSPRVYEHRIRIIYLKDTGLVGWSHSYSIFIYSGACSPHFPMECPPPCIHTSRPHERCPILHRFESQKN
jgi:hypothetical protein